MRAFKTEAVIIKRRNYRDADRILTVFTKEYGKLHIRASGVRKITSRRSPHVELINHSLLGLYKANAYPVLTEAQTIDSFSNIKNDLTKIGYAYHICELVDGLCPENQELRQVFILLKDTIQRLSLTDSSLPVSSIVNNFEIELLSLLGYWNRATSFSQMFDTDRFIENIMEKKLKSKSIFAKLQ